MSLLWLLLLPLPILVSFSFGAYERDRGDIHAFCCLGYGIYVIFAIFNFLFIPIVYFFYPETKGRSLEELDVMFAKAHDEKVSPVKMAQLMPKLEGVALERELAHYFGETGHPDGSNDEKVHGPGSDSTTHYNGKPKETT